MTQVIRVSRACINALTDTGVNNYIFNSAQNTFKIIATGTVTGTITADAQEITVAHAQSTTPTVYALCLFPDSNVTVPNGYQKNDVRRYWIERVDGTNMIFRFYKGASANYSPIVRYYVFEAPIG